MRNLANSLLYTLSAAIFLVGVIAAEPVDAKDIEPNHLALTLESAAKLPRLRSLIISQQGIILAKRAFRGASLDRPVNIKSISKSIISALVGAAIDRGVLSAADQHVATLLTDSLPENADSRLATITLNHLLSMRSGLERTSGRNYGRWVMSKDWVRFVLSRPFVDEPGGRMLYSTGNSHLLSAILTRASGRNTLALARDWLGKPLNIHIPGWQTDPKGIYFGGNNMTLSPNALLRFGEMYRAGGIANGRRILSENWIRQSWQPRTRSPFSGDAYGYGWFITEVCGQPAYYARGFGGQFLYVVPEFGLT
ncbi:MAG: serine hydrolase, partial [Proteobacteria bacterium]|nr:serine hydrolase [Pseudomonadota bacterium]